MVVIRLAAIDKYEVADKIGYISTGGGAFLEFVEGKTLPAVAVACLNVLNEAIINKIMHY